MRPTHSLALAIVATLLLLVSLPLGLATMLRLCANGAPALVALAVFCATVCAAWASATAATHFATQAYRSTGR